MAQSLSKLYLHIIFRVKYRVAQIRREDRNELYAYMGAIIKDNHSIPIMINGMEDHILFPEALPSG
ncbi:MAG: transposase [Marinifilaceae bacterium]